MMGALITATAYFATSFVSSIHMFLLTYGIFSAFGTSFVYMGSIIPIYEYFDKHESKAMALVLTGYSIGLFVWPPLVTVLFNYYGRSGTFMLLAGFMLQMCVFGALLRPFRGEKAATETSKDKKGVCAVMAQGRVFQNKYFLVFCIACLLDSTSVVYMVSYLPTMAQGIGASDTQGALLVSIFGK